ncbi:aminotransferase class III-fold pyridoxal phosphate-dependent enzyme [Tabrizicola sp. J26]|uniref:aminotransferase class III-fold pyridoxal phosphate-dependent enzyme n=1 Tax=Alitabrizicola rongguiensis TaxID=2909234 RepID=UPI001F42D347|nr:aminotransferase class III-fold pyridoxal phosphate-dependent enzyme [Tabrizicola rongguiensis]MCF1709438.1 aminotransferase class III-fold pyridoxal phosphate-dependent enzyme [Tabrizicola rongguiensis]
MASDLADPVPGINLGRLQALFQAETESFLRARPKSAALLQRAAKVMPDGVPMPWMGWLYDHAPPFVAGGQGCRFTDADGFEYVDFNLADLSNTLGYGDTPVARAVARQAGIGLQSLLPSENAIALSEALSGRTGMPFWQYTLSASAANTEVFRIARALTGQRKVVAFSGAYHGHIDATLVERGPEGQMQPAALGLSPDVARETVSVPFNDLGALRAALAPGDVAAVLTEPALTNSTLVLPDPGFLAEACRLTRAAGALFVLDETHTWQLAYGGMKRPMQLACDLLVLGKGLGSGVALGIYGMTAPLAEGLRAGRDGRRDGQKGIATGGTIHGNPLSTAAALAMLEEVQTEAGYVRISALGARLSDGIDALTRSYSLPWRAFRYGPRSGFCLTPHLPRSYDETLLSMHRGFNAARRVFMANRGIWDAIWSAGPQVGFSHGAEEIDLYLDVAADFLDRVM